MKTKICGIKTHEAARAAIDAGAHAIGLNFVSKSVRYIGGLEAAEHLVSAVRREPKKHAHAIHWVGVFVNPPAAEVLECASALALNAIQLHGEETPEFIQELRKRLPLGVQIWKALRVATRNDLRSAFEFGCDAIVLDAKVAGVHGGSGKTFDWSILSGWEFGAPLILSGGLTPENVAAAIQSVHPDVVDVASGVESAPGVKDAQLIRDFINAANTLS